MLSVWMDGCRLLINKKVNLHFSKKNAKTNTRETWYVGSGGHKYYPPGLSSPNCIFNTSFAYLFWMTTNKKDKYPEFCMGYSDEPWYVGRGEQKYYQCGLLSLKAHI